MGTWLYCDGAVEFQVISMLEYLLVVPNTEF